jgi:hypothetical protein
MLSSAILFGDCVSVAAPTCDEVVGLVYTRARAADPFNAAWNWV